MPLQYTFSEWYDFAVSQVAEMSKTDRLHQEMKKELQDAEAAFDTICKD